MCPSQCVFSSFVVAIVAVLSHHVLTTWRTHRNPLKRKRFNMAPKGGASCQLPIHHNLRNPTLCDSYSKIAFKKTWSHK